MSAPNLKSWKVENSTLLSPPFPDERAFKSCKKFLIRAWINADFDDNAMFIRISINEEHTTGKGNLEKLCKLKLINKKDIDE